jgi:hypothetical protein
MFESFQRNFRRDLQGERAQGGKILGPDIAELREFFAEFGGASFQDGLYRVIHPAELDEWQERICLAFPEFEGRITCFGFDWLGSAFAIDSGRLEGGKNGVVMFEPGTGEALEIPANLVSFHDSGLLEFGEAALAISFYEKWRASGGPAPAYDQCIGYKKPLFLGGGDEVDNLGRSDLDVYWHIIGQLIRKTKGLPEGTPVRVRMN